MIPLLVSWIHAKTKPLKSIHTVSEEFKCESAKYQLLISVVVVVERTVTVMLPLQSRKDMNAWMI